MLYAGPRERWSRRRGAQPRSEAEHRVARAPRTLGPSPSLSVIGRIDIGEDLAQLAECVLFGPVPRPTLATQHPRSTIQLPCLMVVLSRADPAHKDRQASIELKHAELATHALLSTKRVRGNDSRQSAGHVYQAANGIPRIIAATLAAWE